MATFEYSKYVTGKNNIGRKSEAVIMANLISQGENICLCEPPKSGKTSLIQQTLYNMRLDGKQLAIASVSFLSLRESSDLLCAIADAALKLSANSPSEFASLIKELLEGTHFVFDPQVYSASGKIVSTNWELDENDIRAILRLPRKLALRNAQKMLFVIDDFQTISLADPSDKILRIWEQECAAVPSENRSAMSWLFCGSLFNAMMDIFAVKRFFYRHVTRVELKPVDEKEIVEHMVKGFLSTGKVIERELMAGACKLLRGNLWYMNHLCAICDSLTKGFIMEPTLVESLEMLIAIHEPRFVAAVSDLTNFQTRLLRAIIDGHTQFSSSEIIRTYGLNSSANVKRLKDALVKKEIVSFDDDDTPRLLDPLFEYWLTKYYFEIQK
ncbi:MAG: hypothetical protein IJU69_06775 [Bacteroidales bacterium]|nr:hypothetical protein [Bacteroidales bacterium]